MIQLCLNTIEMNYRNLTELITDEFLSKIKRSSFCILSVFSPVYLIMNSIAQEMLRGLIDWNCELSVEVVAVE